MEVYEQRQTPMHGVLTITDPHTNEAHRFNIVTMLCDIHTRNKEENCRELPGWGGE